MKYRVLLVIVLLLPTFIILVLNSGLFEDCISEEKAAPVFAKAEQLEKEGKIYDARHVYKVIDYLGCSNISLRGKSSDRVSKLGMIIDEAYKVSMNELNEFHLDNKRYPESLEEIRSRIPQELIHAFNGFRYTKNDDGTVGIVKGRTGRITLNLGK